jgi:hypothetical protein
MIVDRVVQREGDKFYSGDKISAMDHGLIMVIMVRQHKVKLVLVSEGSAPSHGPEDIW